jgi:uncharacterized protein
MNTTVILFLKAPRDGQVKTRLARSVGGDEALRIYRSLAEAQVRQLPPGWRTEVHFAPADAEAEMKGWLGESTERMMYRPQNDGDLGARLVAGFASAFADGGSPVIAIGGDCPELDAACLENARLALREADVVLGPATDGGYYLIGLNRPAPELFDDVPWSTPRVLEITRARADATGLRYRLLEPKTDIDDAESWAHYAQTSMHSSGPLLTVIMPVLNEAAGIQSAVRAARNALPGMRVIVVDGGSSDGTAALARSAGAEIAFSVRGRGLQLAAGAALASTEWLLFLHADTTLPDAAAHIIDDFTRQPGARVATFRLRFDRAGWFLRACCWFTRFDTVFTRFGDQGMLIRADFYRALGGFPAWALFEDVALLQRARRSTRVCSLTAAVTTSARRFEQFGHVRQQWLNARLLCRYLLGTPPDRLAEIYRASAKPRRVAIPTPLPLFDEAGRSKR